MLCQGLVRKKGSERRWVASQRHQCDLGRCADAQREPPVVGARVDVEQRTSLAVRSHRKLEKQRGQAPADSRNRQLNAVLQTLAASIDTRDPLTAGHSEKVTEYASGICSELNLTNDACETIRVAAMLHDYGKIGVPDAILKKPGRLTKEEYDIVKTHAMKSRDILTQINFSGSLRRVPEIAGAHHEKIDGSGYPLGLKGDQIPLGAKIIAVADFFEAITAKRHYRDPLPLETAFDLLEKESGVHFEPHIVEAFVRFYQKANPNHHIDGLTKMKKVS